MTIDNCHKDFVGDKMSQIIQITKISSRSLPNASKVHFKIFLLSNHTVCFMQFHAFQVCHVFRTCYRTFLQLQKILQPCENLISIHMKVLHLGCNVFQLLLRLRLTVMSTVARWRLCSAITIWKRFMSGIETNIIIWYSVVQWNDKKAKKVFWRKH